MENRITFEKDYVSTCIIANCRLNAPLKTVWDAFTNPIILEKWFAPEPYRAVTKVMEFKNGGTWLYYMLSPEGKKHWGTSVFSNIRINESFEASDGFCDENGVIDLQLPQMNWFYQFQENDGKTLVSVTIIPSNEAQMKQVLEMGFEDGYKMALNQLQQLLKEQL